MNRITPQSQQNSFNTIRLLCATAVIFSHAFNIVNGTGVGEPLYDLTNGQLTIGKASVGIFFVVSGLLISASFEKSRSLLSYAIKRGCRILPGLSVCVILLALIFGPLMTSLPLAQYFSAHLFVDFLKNIVFLPSQYALPGVFESNPMPQAVNGSLWTLKYEILCYILGPIFLSIKKYRHHVLIIFWVVSFIVARKLGSHEGLSGPMYHLYQTCALFRFYGAGMLIYFFHKEIPVNIPIMISLFAVTVFGLFTDFAEEALAIAGSLFIVSLAYNSSQFFRNITKSGDISYGVYIYAFPIQQLVVYLLGEKHSTVMSNTMISVILTLLIAWLSWLFVERPFLNIGHSLSTRFGVNKNAKSTPVAG
jgi:peptidoglycan/LPS O-acetylase OafA/YrhL